MCVNRVQKPLIPTWRHRMVLSTLLLTATATAFVLVLVPPAFTQQNPKPQIETRRAKQNSIWDAIWKLVMKRDEPSLSSRDGVCVINPGLLGEKNVIWSDRPLFLWQGKVQNLEVRPYSLDTPYSGQKVLWSQTVIAGSQSATYTGETLQPGQTYDWQLVVVDSSPRRLRFTFQVMDAQSRDRITDELTAMETQLKSAGATPEAITLAKAKYFAERDLWSDALQEVYSVQNPSTELTKNTQELSSNLCNS